LDDRLKESEGIVEALQEAVRGGIKRVLCNVLCKLLAFFDCSYAMEGGSLAVRSTRVW